MTFGVTDICTASNTSRPARSIAHAFSNAIGMFARCAAIRALITRSTLPPARKCVSSWEMFSPRPALFALISGCTRRCGLMWRIFMPMSAPIDTCTPLDSAEIHSPSGTNDRNTHTTTNTTAIIPRIIAILPSMMKILLPKGRCPFTPPEALPLDSTRDKGNGTKSPLDPFSRFSWLLLHAVSAC